MWNKYFIYVLYKFHIYVQFFFLVALSGFVLIRKKIVIIHAAKNIKIYDQNSLIILFLFYSRERFFFILFHVSHSIIIWHYKICIYMFVSLKLFFWYKNVPYKNYRALRKRKLFLFVQFIVKCNEMVSWRWIIAIKWWMGSYGI